MNIIKFLPFLFIVPGFIAVYAAKLIVMKFSLNEKTKCPSASEMTAEEVVEYKMTRATVGVKVAGFLFALPGIIWVMWMFR